MLPNHHRLRRSTHLLRHPIRRMARPQCRSTLPMRRPHQQHMVATTTRRQLLTSQLLIQPATRPRHITPLHNSIQHQVHTSNTPAEHQHRLPPVGIPISSSISSSTSITMVAGEVCSAKTAHPYSIHVNVLSCIFVCYFDSSSVIKTFVRPQESKGLSIF